MVAPEATDDRLFDQAFAPEEQSAVVFDGRDDQHAHAHAVACQRVGKQLIPEYCRFFCGNSHFGKGNAQIFSARFSRIGVDRQSQIPVKQVYPFRLVVGDQRDADAGVLQSTEPGAQRLVRLCLRVGCKRIVNVRNQCTDAVFLQKFRRYIPIGPEEVIG